LQPVREALPYSYQSWIVVYILQDSTGKINIFLPDLTIFLSPPALLYLPPAGKVPRPRARNIPFENKSAGRCGRRVRAQRLPVRKKERPPKRSFFFGSELSSN